MIVNFQVRFADSRVQQIITNLKRNQSPSYATRIKMADLAEKALEILRKHFPRGAGGPRENENPETAYSGHLQSGWKVSVLKSGQVLGFDFRNVIAERNEHAKKVLHFLDAGTQEVLNAYNEETGQYGMRVKRPMSFLSKRLTNYLTFSKPGKRVTIGAMSVIRRPARAGLHYYAKTRREIVSDLMGTVRDRIRERLLKV